MPQINLLKFDFCASLKVGGKKMPLCSGSSFVSKVFAPDLIGFFFYFFFYLTYFIYEKVT